MNAFGGSMKDESRAITPEAAPRRVAEDRAARILERAAALDAKRNSEIEIDQLREAAEDAGISREAFEEALRESSVEDMRGGKSGKGKRGPAVPVRDGGGHGLATADIAHYAALLRDVLGDEGQVTVSDAIEWRDEEGLSVSVNPTATSITCAVTAEGRLRRRILSVVLPALLPLSVFFLIAFEEEEAFIGFIGVLLAMCFSVLGSVISHRREQKTLRKKAERIRRQLQRLLVPPEEV